MSNEHVETVERWLKWYAEEDALDMPKDEVLKAALTWALPVMQAAAGAPASAECEEVAVLVECHAAEGTALTPETGRRAAAMIRTPRVVLPAAPTPEERMAHAAKLEVLAVRYENDMPEARDLREAARTLRRCSRATDAPPTSAERESLAAYLDEWSNGTGSSEFNAAVRNVAKMLRGMPSSVPTSAEREALASGLDGWATVVHVANAKKCMRAAAKALRGMPSDATEEACEEARKHRATLRMLCGRGFTHVATGAAVEAAVKWAAFSTGVTAPPVVVGEPLEDGDAEEVARLKLCLTDARRRIDALVKDRDGLEGEAAALRREAVAAAKHHESECERLRDLLGAATQRTLDVKVEFGEKLKEFEVMRAELERRADALGHQFVELFRRIRDEVKDWATTAGVERDRSLWDTPTRQAFGKEALVLERVLGLFALAAPEEERS